MWRSICNGSSPTRISRTDVHSLEPVPGEAFVGADSGDAGPLRVFDMALVDRLEKFDAKTVTSLILISESFLASEPDCTA